MRRKLLVGGLGVAIGVLVPGWFGSGATSQALSCPGQLSAACGGVDLVIATVCNPQIPDVPTVGFVTIIVDDAPILACPQLPV